MDSKRLLLVMAVSLGLLVIWTLFFPPKGDDSSEDTKGEGKKTVKVARKKEGSKKTNQPKKNIDRKSTESRPSGMASVPTEQKVADDRKTSDSPTDGTEPGKPQKAKTKKPVPAQKITRVAGKLFLAEFSSWGGVLRKIRLEKKQYREKDKRTGKTRQVNLVRTLRAEYMPLLVTFQNSSFRIESPQIWEPVRWVDGKWEPPGERPHSVLLSGKTVFGYRWTDPKGKVQVVKAYRVNPNRSYWFEMEVSVRNLTQQRVKEKLTVSVPSMDYGEKGRSYFQPISLKREAICRVNGEVRVRSYDHILGKAKDGCMEGCSACSCQRTPAKSNAFAGTVNWGGIDEKYFLLAVAPVGAKGSAQCRFGGMRIAAGGLMWTDLNFPEREVGPSAAEIHRFVVYAGPKDVDLLSSVKPRGQHVHLDDSVDFGILWFLGKPMLWLLRFFQRFVGNWGIAIILITLLIKLLTLHWNNKSMRSMKEMQKLKPLMDGLKEKYGDDKQRYQQEVANLWKRHKINPARGCLPMLFQLQIYIAWYQALMAAVELYRAPLFGWIDDLTAPDPYYVMPILMGAAMFLQQKMSPTTADNTQAKMMMYMMPAMFTFFMLFLPSGLTLYILVNVLLSMLHQWYLNHSE